ncbi:LysR family transcriptional regulator [Xylophilus rhododendri]|uniref:LysR family transcriptional regulator n=1 Tax=Xylophilus rhododendri TaxID=2697032 RepID=A0A857JCE2_9BURK|nr:LysR substrate-binding domain-containing protein [Xylophilus rhododendri]QHJ00633.1 LysR family transcriptional regulator [Xylophilus rhododendri]
MDRPLTDAFSRGLQLRHMRCLVAIAQERHLARAAERLAVSQPAVSRILAELEALAGVRLVERSDSGRRGIRGLTPDGERLLPLALRMLEAVQQASAALRPDMGDATVRLRLGALPSAAQSLVPAALARLREQVPALRLEVQVAANDELLDDLRAGALDLVVGRMSDPRLMEGLSFELLRIEPLMLLVRADHPLARRRPALHALIEYPWVVYPEGTVPRHHTESLLDARGLGLPTGLTQTLDMAVARGLVMRSDAVWATPAGAVQDDIAEGRLKAVLVDAAGTEEPVGLLRRRDVALPPVAETLAALLRRGALPAKGARRGRARAPA